MNFKPQSKNSLRLPLKKLLETANLLDSDWKSYLNNLVEDGFVEGWIFDESTSHVEIFYSKEVEISLQNQSTSFEQSVTENPGLNKFNT